MGGIPDQADYEARLRKALQAMQQMRLRLDALERARSEPLAVIGMSCRFPGGAVNPESYWQLLHNGIDAITEIPPSRWDLDAYYNPDPMAPGKMYTRCGGFLSEVDRFDAAFFGIAPREAVAMDPQQRLLLELSWEALEDAAQSPDRLAGTRSGVYVGISTSDYSLYHVSSGEPERIDAYSGTGVALSIAAGRVSYVLGFQGPTVAVDTFCSSSLVATHLACQGLRLRECDLALAGGVNLLLSPLGTVYSCKVRALAPDGRCKTFDASADGYVRGEGGGIIVLKRLSDAVQAGDKILAVIRGSAANHDGRSSGLTVPNGQAQQAVIRAALANGGVDAGDVSYVEAHGTGTPLGDPIELRSLAAALGDKRSKEDPLIVASAKTNFGHLEAAAGVAGLMKVVLSLGKREIPPHLHFRQPNPHVPWEELPIKIPVQAMPWEPAGKPRIAGVSSFGFSGTNAHIILEEAPEAANARGHEAPSARSAYLLPMSARSPEALRSLVAAYRDLLSAKPGDLPSLHDLCYTASVRRSHHPYRAFVVAGSSDEFVRRLKAEELVPDIAPHTDRAPEGAVFVFPNSPSGLWEMGLELYQEEPAFREILDQCDAQVREQSGRSILAELRTGDAGGPGEKEGVTPSFFSLQMALSALWKSWGITPQAVLGEGNGEIAAACVAGILPLADAVRVAVRGGRRSVNPGSNGASAFVPTLGDLQLQREEIPFISAASATHREAVKLDGEYWASLASEAACLDAAIDKLVGEGQTIFLEVGAVALGDRALAGRVAKHGKCAKAISSARTGVRAYQALLTALGELYASGLSVNWNTVYRSGGKVVRLPSYPWNRQRFWVDDVPIVRAPKFSGFASESEAHPLIGRRIVSPVLKQVVFESRIGANSPAFLGDHRVRSQVLFPTSGFVEMAWAAGRATFRQPVELREVVIRQALPVSEESFARVQTILTREGESEATIQIFSQAADAPGDAPIWVVHAEGKLRGYSPRPAATPPMTESLTALRSRLANEISGREFYEKSKGLGLNYGAAFQGVTWLRWNAEEALAAVNLPEALGSEAAKFSIHPALFDSCLQTFGAAVLAGRSSDTFLPSEIESLELLAPPGTHVLAHLLWREPPSSGTLVGNLELFSTDGKLVARAKNVVCRRAPREDAKAGSRTIPAYRYVVDWRPKENLFVEEQGEPGLWLVLAGKTGIASGICDLLEGRKQQCIRVAAGTRFASWGGGRFEVDPKRPEDFRQVLQEALAQTAMPLHGVVDLWALDMAPCGNDPSGLAGQLESLCGSALHLVQAVARARLPDPPRFCLVTRSGQALGAAGCSPLQASLAGLARVIRSEYSDLHPLLFDLGLGDSEAVEARALFEEVLARDVEDVAALRGGVRYVPRLTRAAEASAAPFAGLRADATYLITGGLGALGLRVARWMVTKGGRSLAILARSEPSEFAKNLLSELRLQAVDVRVFRTDVAQAAELASALEQIRESMPAVRGVVHAAGTLDDGLLVQQDWRRFDRVLAPKALGAWNLHEQTLETPLDFFVLFSSLSALLGSPGQGSYAAANAFLDGLVHDRRSKGLPAVSIDWGAWSRSGMSARMSERDRRAWADQGIEALEPEEAIRELEKVLASSSPQVAVARVDWQRFTKKYPAGGEAPLLSELAREARQKMEADEGSMLRLRLLRRLEAASHAERLEILAEFVREQVSEVLGYGSAPQVDPNRGFFEIGMDSLMAVDLQRRLQSALGVSLPSTLGFDHPTVESLAKYLAEKALSFQRPAARAVPPAVGKQVAGRERLEQMAEDQLVSLLAEELDDLAAE